MFGLLMEKVSGFTQLASSMVQCLDIDGPVHSGRFMVSMKDSLKRLPVTQSLHSINKKEPLWNKYHKGLLIYSSFNIQEYDCSF
jgi:hypothetical protein